MYCFYFRWLFIVSYNKFKIKKKLWKLLYKIKFDWLIKENNTLSLKGLWNLPLTFYFFPQAFIKYIYQAVERMNNMTQKVIHKSKWNRPLWGGPAWVCRQLKPSQSAAGSSPVESSSGLREDFSAWRHSFCDSAPLSLNSSSLAFPKAKLCKYLHAVCSSSEWWRTPWDRQTSHDSVTF